jgi:hypothetical protein
MVRISDRDRSGGGKLAGKAGVIVDFDIYNQPIVLGEGFRKAFHDTQIERVISPA